ncbi:MAG: hypothetical protein JWM11_6711 [Planctomycetaceae bacterium]|nr:hypothetical protein [Planctomycetaceae bacterium]
MTESNPSKKKRLSEQAQAMELLTQARDILAARLTERVLELGGDLLDDARGESYAGEIDSLYDQIGTRLNQVNTMLAGLPAACDVPATESFTAAPGSPEGPHFVVQTIGPTSENTGELYISEDLAIAKESPPKPCEPSTYPLFVQDIIRRDAAVAGRRLATVLDMTAERGERCAQRFREQLDRDPSFLGKVQELRRSLHSGASNEALLLLWECFGLQGDESISAMQTLRGWL